MLSPARKLRMKDNQELTRHKIPKRFLRTKLKPSQIKDVPTPVEIVKGLNKRPITRAAKRVSRFIHLFKQAGELSDSFRLCFDSRDEMISFLHSAFLDQSQNRPARYKSQGERGISGTGWSFEPAEMQAINNRLIRVLEEINAIAKRIKWHPFVRHIGYEMSPALRVVDYWKIRDRERAWETHSIWWLCGENGMWIDYFRRCPQCGLWFFAVANHQIYCSGRCRQNKASTSEEFKQKRKLYMRVYRRDEKERQLRAKTLVRRSKTK
jgi:hypothetical protein